MKPHICSQFTEMPGLCQKIFTVKDLIQSLRVLEEPDVWTDLLSGQVFESINQPAVFLFSTMERTLTGTRVKIN